MGYRATLVHDNLEAVTLRSGINIGRDYPCWTGEVFCLTLSAFLAALDSFVFLLPSSDVTYISMEPCLVPKKCSFCLQSVGSDTGSDV